MVSSSTLTFALSTLFSLTTAAPSGVPLTGVVHRVTAGSTTVKGGLHFEPENISAQMGDMITFEFLPKNHSIVQSSFDKPCEPLPNGSGVFSGFNFATAEGLSNQTFSFVVNDTKPFWFYCAQTVGNHCQNGMSGVINQNFDDNEKTLAKYKENAAKATTVQPEGSPTNSHGGWIEKFVPL